MKMVKKSMAGRTDEIGAPFEYLRRFQHVISSTETFSGKFDLQGVHDCMARNVICSIKTVLDLLRSDKDGAELFSEQVNHITRMHLRQVTLTLFT